MSSILTPNSNDPNSSVPFNVPTLNADPTLGSLISLSGIRCVNAIAGGALTVKSATITVNQQILFLNTSGSRPVFINMDNGGLVGGVSTYMLGSGSNLFVIFDGTNLHN